MPAACAGQMSARRFTKADRANWMSAAPVAALDPSQALDMRPEAGLDESSAARSCEQRKDIRIRIMAVDEARRELLKLCDRSIDHNIITRPEVGADCSYAHDNMLKRVGCQVCWVDSAAVPSAC